MYFEFQPLFDDRISIVVEELIQLYFFKPSMCSNSPKYFILYANLRNSSLNLFQGGYLGSISRKRCLCITAFSWLKVSKEYFPWYLPKPLWPTPPNGSESHKNCTQNDTNNQTGSLLHYAVLDKTKRKRKLSQGRKAR